VAPSDVDPVEAIRDELFRLRADEGSVGPTDAIKVKDRGEGYAQLTGSPRKHPDFQWFGPAGVILERLSGLPDSAGPEVVRSEFADGVS
jgi:hypothetical protein